MCAPNGDTLAAGRRLRAPGQPGCPGHGRLCRLLRRSRVSVSTTRARRGDVHLEDRRARRRCIAPPPAIWREQPQPTRAEAQRRPPNPGAGRIPAERKGECGPARRSDVHAKTAACRQRKVSSELCARCQPVRHPGREPHFGALTGDGSRGAQAGTRTHLRTGLGRDDQSCRHDEDEPPHLHLYAGA
jgi:hypothetical protein